MTGISGSGLRWIGAVAAAVVATWLLSPNPGGRVQVSSSPEPWEMPTAIAARSSNAVSPAGLAQLWGSAPEFAESAPSNQPAWRIIGIVRAGGDRFVLVKVDGQPERRLAIGESLPGGSRILGIEEDAVCILVNGAKRRLGIYLSSTQVL